MSSRDERSARLGLEPSAVFPSLEGGREGPAEAEIEHSKAISLKRIADALWGTPGTTGILRYICDWDARS